MNCIEWYASGWKEEEEEATTSAAKHDMHLARIVQAWLAVVVAAATSSAATHAAERNGHRKNAMHRQSNVARSKQNVYVCLCWKWWVLVKPKPL